MGVREEILRVFPMEMRTLLQTGIEDFAKLEEIRVRGERPILLKYAGEEWVMEKKGRLLRATSDAGQRLLETGQAYAVRKELLPEILSYLSNYSLYAVEEQLRQGFLTIAGGHRVGICGQMLPDSTGGFRMNRVGSMNFRIAQERVGCSREIVSHFDLVRSPGSLVLVSPPGVGKTTLLRDLIRELSVSGYTVGVVDERSEIGACYEGFPQNDLGVRTDVLDACGKKEGLSILLRTMAPDYLALDEVTDAAELAHVREAMHRGCHLLVTCHAKNREELLRHRAWRELFAEGGFRGIVTVCRKAGGRREMVMEDAYVG